MIAISPDLSYISDSERGTAIILAERTGQYYEISINVLGFLLSVGRSAAGIGSEELEDLCDNEAARDCIKGLIGAGLLLPGDGSQSGKRQQREKKQRSSFTKSRRRKTFFSTLASKQSVERRQPRLWIALFLAGGNLWYRLRLALEGWRPVRVARQEQKRNIEQETAIPVDLQYQVIDELVAAMRMSCLLPWVRRDCVPSSLALHSLLRYLGFSPYLVVGAKVFPFEPHMWVELWGKRIDSGVDEQSLDSFEPLGRNPRHAGRQLAS